MTFGGHACTTSGGRDPNARLVFVDTVSDATTALIPCTGNCNGYLADIAGKPSTVCNTVSCLRGTMRSALALNVPRFIMPVVSGVWIRGSRVTITNPYFTVACQTAPTATESGGIGDGGFNFQEKGTYVFTHDGVFQHCRMRGNTDVGDHQLTFGDYTYGGPVYNIVCDHCSIGLGITSLTVGAVTTGAGSMVSVSHNNLAAPGVAFVDSVISAPIWTAPTGGGGPGHILQGSQTGAGTGAGVTVLRTQYAFIGNRAPLAAQAGEVAIVNTHNYNWAGAGSGGEAASYGALMLAPQAHPNVGVPARATTMAAVGNFFKRGINSGSDFGAIKIGCDSQAKAAGIFAFLTFNQDSDGEFTPTTGNGQWNTDAVSFPSDITAHGPNVCTQGNTRIDTSPTWFTNLAITTLATSAVEAFLASDGGAFPIDRDGHDTMVFGHIAAGTFDMTNKNTIAEYGGLPSIVSGTQDPLAVPANPNGINPVDGVRSNIEIWLESMARRLEPRW